jgi:hypothetical protein
VVRMILASEALPSGSRLEAQRWTGAEAH